MIVFMVEVKHLEQVADRRHVAWDVWITGGCNRVGKIIAALVCQRLEAPVSFDEF